MSATVNPFFTPTQISGCRLWLDAADPTSLSLSGRNVAGWRDKSGIGNDYSQTTPGNQPLYTVDSVYNRPCLSFNGSGTFLNQTNTSQYPISNTNTFSIFTAHRINSGSGIYNVYRGQLISGRYWLRWQSTFANFITDRDPEGYINFASGNISAMNGISAFMNDTTTAEGFINGTSVGSASKTATTINQYFTIGASSSSGGEVLLGSLFEMIVYNSLLTPTQRQQVEGYLAWKWGLQASLPATHPYKISIIPPLLNPPATAAALVQNTTPTWLPTQISGCQLWLDGADPNGTGVLPANGASVTTWVDKSGQGYSTSNLTGSPTFSSNGIVFTGTQAMGTNLGFAATLSNSTMFCITSYTSAFNGAFIETNVTLGNNGSGIDFFVTGGQQRVNGWATGLIVNGATGVSINTRNLHELTLATGATGSAYLYLDGALGGSNIALNFTYTAGGLFTLGNWKNGASYGTFFTGIINEVVVYSSILTTQQRQQVEGYLAWKWGLQGNLPSSNVYKQAPPFVPAAAFPPLTVVKSGIWTPLQISGCSLWLDAADRATLSVTGSNVTQWIDKSGTTNVSQGTSALQPTYLASGFNGRPTLRITGVSGSSYQELTTGTTTQYDSVTAMYVFLVYRVITPVPANPGIFSIQNKVSYYLRGLDNNNNFTGSNVWTYNGASFVANNDTIVTYDQNGFLSLGLDGGFQSTYLSGSFTGAPKAFSFGSGTSLVLRIGYSGYNTSDGFNGFISEVLVYKASLSTAQRQQVEGYLAWKWGLQGNLPAGHPWKNWPPPP